MADREKVIKGLECCTSTDIELCTAQKCPYWECCGGDWTSFTMLADALALLKAQEPRVMTWKEAQASVNSGPFIIMEVRDNTGTEVGYGVLVDDLYEMSDGSLLTVREFWMLEEEYGKRFRCWTSRPTDEQRKAVAWDD